MSAGKVLDNYAHNAYSIIEVRVMKFREIERILLDDGWVFKDARGSHYHYIHPVKSGKVTIPNHTGDLDKRTLREILRQAGVNDGGKLK